VSTETRRPVTRRLAVGAEALPEGGVHFRVWAPRRRRVEVVFEGQGRVALAPEPGGYFSGLVEEARPGARYRFRLDGEGPFPDPASRFQPEGPHGPSAVVDPAAFRWTDAGWRGVGRRGQVLYELHVGTFTRAGTWAAAAAELPRLADLGVTLLEVMPIADFSGRFGWGYDGVDLFAPTRLYGEPDDARRFVDRAHALGLGVILDVVYNHLGPDGNYLEQFSASYFTDRHRTDWGKAINFDGEDASPVRELFVENAGYWIAEYHMDGLRLDATQDIHDDSPDHVLAAIARRARQAAGDRQVFLVAENEPQDAILVRPPEAGGYGLDAMWNDDFHHSAYVALSGRSEAYYSDYRGTPQELLSAARHGFLYQGQRYAWQGKRRGTPALDLPHAAFVHFLQNHDQVANSARGERGHELAGTARYRALTALLLLGPATPLLFQGQEFCASSPFVYFADHGPELAPLVRQGRLDFLAQFPSLTAPEMQEEVPDPGAPESFALCQLDPEDRRRHAKILALHRDLLRLRREDPVFRRQGEDGLDGAVLGPDAFVLRFFAPAPPPGRAAGADGDRLLLVNLGADLHLESAPEPLLAPPLGCRWRLLWSSEAPRYGGSGATEPENADGWWIAGRSALVVVPDPTTSEPEPRPGKKQTSATGEERGEERAGEPRGEGDAAS
jgi:maltooligosyltrehalose trehalohydrolase